MNYTTHNNKHILGLQWFGRLLGNTMATQTHSAFTRMAVFGNQLSHDFSGLLDNYAIAKDVALK